MSSKYHSDYNVVQPGVTVIAYVVLTGIILLVYEAQAETTVMV